MDYFEYNYTIFLIGALALLFSFRLFRAIRYKEFNLSRELVILALALFVAFLSTQTFEPYYIRMTDSMPRYNLIPLKSIRNLFIKGLTYNNPETKHLHTLIIYINLLGNLLIFAPIGFFSALLFKEPKWYKSLLAGFSLSLCIEIVQIFLITRSFDVDDLLLNSLGTLIGYLIFKLFMRIPVYKRFSKKSGNSQRPKGILWTALYIFTVIILSLAIFLHQYKHYLITPYG